jgi:amino acid permease
VSFPAGSIQLSSSFYFLKPFNWIGSVALTFTLHWRSDDHFPLVMDKLSREQSIMKTPYEIDHEKGEPIYQTTSGPVAGDVFDGSYGTTQRGLKSRHAQMIALGGTIGTGLFVGSGQTLARGGPAFILGTFIFMAALIWMIVTGKLLCLIPSIRDLR